MTPGSSPGAADPGRPPGPPPEHRILLTGATGYVGGRLLPRLLEAGCFVRCLARHPDHVHATAAPGQLETVRADLCDAAVPGAAFEGIDTAFYLVHALGTARDFAEEERTAARNFAVAARAARVGRIVYLGGLGRGPGLSPHLASRQEVGRLLRASGVPTWEFRCAVILGSGSLSFEMIRSLVERLPVLVTPRWVSVPTQPIAIEDVLAYLLAAVDRPGHGSRVFEIGGPDRTSYGGIMAEYARQRGLRRRMLRVPVLTPRLSSRWLRLVTPLYARVGRKLIEGLRNPTVVESDAAREVFPALRPRGVREAIARALANEDEAFAATRWCDAVAASGAAGGAGAGLHAARRVDSRAAHSPADPETVFAAVEALGGDTGWYFGNALWRLRGAIDLLAGGPGLRRGRRDPLKLRAGDVVDFWRVEAIERPALLRLRAEMRLPGRAWLQFEVRPSGGGSLVRQTALFDPAGLGGRLYGYAVYPLHALVFRGMLRGLVRAAARPAPRCLPARRASRKLPRP